MSTLKLEEKITSNYMISKTAQIYLTCAQLQVLETFGFKYIKHNIFYNEQLNIYTSIKNCYSFTNEKNHYLINNLNKIMYNEYFRIENTYRKKVLKNLLKDIVKEQ